MGTDNVLISIAGSGNTDSIANAIVKAINDAGLGLSPQNTGGGFIAIGGDSFVSITASNTVLQVVGSPDAGANQLIAINLRNVSDGTQIAALAAAAIRAANLPGVEVTAFGARLFIEGAEGVVGTGAKPIEAITDLAGNPIRANQIDGRSVATIQLGSGFDYGDAPDPSYKTLNASNGPRHKLVAGFSLGATASVDGDARVIDNDSGDDGVRFADAIYSAFTTQIVVNAQGITGTRPGFLTAWIDFDGDGAFETSERLVAGFALSNGTTTYQRFAFHRQPEPARPMLASG